MTTWPVCTTACICTWGCIACGAVKQQRPMQEVMRQIRMRTKRMMQRSVSRPIKSQ